MKSAPNLQFDVQRSRIEFVLVGALAALAISSVWLSRLPITLQVVGTVGVVLAFALKLRRYLRPESISCALQPDGRWQIRSGTSDSPAKLTDARDLGLLIALQFTPEHGRRIDIALWPDSITPDTRRRLRVWMGRGRVG